jgi:hypothetical protein
MARYFLEDRNSKQVIPLMLEYPIGVVSAVFSMARVCIVDEAVGPPLRNLQGTTAVPEA